MVFETPSSTQESKDTRMASPPHPFVIEPPATTETHFEKGNTFDFHLLLFGQNNEYLPYFIYAFALQKKHCTKDVDTCGACTDCFHEIQSIYDKQEEILLRAFYCLHWT